jgi:hypothetical protein
MRIKDTRTKRLSVRLRPEQHEYLERLAKSDCRIAAHQASYMLETWLEKLAEVVPDPSVLQIGATTRYIRQLKPGIETRDQLSGHIEDLATVLRELSRIPIDTVRHSGRRRIMTTSERAELIAVVQRHGADVAVSTPIRF